MKKPLFTGFFEERKGHSTFESLLLRSEKEAQKGFFFWAEVKLKGFERRGRSFEEATEAKAPVARLRRRPAWKAAEPPVGIPPPPLKRAPHGARFHYPGCLLFSSGTFAHARIIFLIKIILAQSDYRLLFYWTIFFPGRIIKTPKKSQQIRNS